MQRQFQVASEKESLAARIHLTGSARCGDRERNETAEFLGYVFAGGYLSQDEFEIRKNLALTATVISELQVLRSDIPVNFSLWQVKPAEPEKRKRIEIGSLSVGLFVFLLGVLDAVASPDLRALAWSGVLVLLGLSMMLMARIEKMRKT